MSIVVTDELILLHCAECGISFGITRDYYDRRRADGQGFLCPAGHSNVYRETEVQRLRRELEDEKAAKERAYQREKEALQRLSAARGQITKITKRIGCGVCPCCNRSFQNLRRHMDNKHPNFKKAKKSAPEK